MVDSGADGTLLPRSIAQRLGITDLTATTHGSGGAGGTTFETWETSSQVNAQVLFSPPGQSLQAWGPAFQLEPVFAEGTTPLLGRADFFPPFSITFQAHPTLGPVFHLDV